MSASYLDLHLEIDNEVRLRTKLNDKTFQQHLHMEYIYLSRNDIQELVVPIRIFLIAGCC